MVIFGRFTLHPHGVDFKRPDIILPAVVKWSNPWHLEDVGIFDPAPKVDEALAGLNLVNLVWGEKWLTPYQYVSRMADHRIGINSFRQTHVLTQSGVTIINGEVLFRAERSYHTGLNVKGWSGAGEGNRVANRMSLEPTPKRHTLSDFHFCQFVLGGFLPKIKLVGIKRNPRSFLADDEVYVILRGLRAGFSHFDRLLENHRLRSRFGKLPVHDFKLASHDSSLTAHFYGLDTDNSEGFAEYAHLPNQGDDLQQTDAYQSPCNKYELPLNAKTLLCEIVVGILLCVVMGGGINLVMTWNGCFVSLSSRRGLCGWCLILVSSLLLFVDMSFAVFGNPLGALSFLLGNDQDEGCYQEQVFHRRISYPTKYFLTSSNYWDTVFIGGWNQMANTLSTEKQTMIIGALAEGSSIRSIERMTGVHRDTIMRLGVKVGQGCTTMMDAKMRNLTCKNLQLDEIWGFIGKKERHCRPTDNPELGDTWTFCAIDSDTKLVPSFKVGKRDRDTANAFVADTASRLTKRVQLSSDSMRSYIEAIELAFGSDVDYAQIIKEYGHDDSISPERKYSPPKVLSTEKRRISGNPDMELASTSYVERLNGTTRLHMRRLTRLTYAFSKKLDNFKAAVGLHFAYYNFVLRHSTLRCTPAMEAGIERDFWKVHDLVREAA
jgi:IS1 family transposase